MRHEILDSINLAKQTLFDLGMDNKIGLNLNEFVKNLEIKENIKVKLLKVDFESEKDIFNLINVNKDTNGFIVKKPNVNEYLVVANTLLTKEQMLFTYAHELGHIVLKHGIDNVRLSSKKELLGSDKTINIEEQAANAFAAELLVPENILKVVYGKFNKTVLADAFGVSIMVFNNRIKDLGLV